MLTFRSRGVVPLATVPPMSDGTVIALPAALTADHLTVPTGRPTSPKLGSASDSDPRLHPATKGTLTAPGPRARGLLQVVRRRIRTRCLNCHHWHKGKTRQRRPTLITWHLTRTSFATMTQRSSYWCHTASRTLSTPWFCVSRTVFGHLPEPLSRWHYFG
jgi:hypothetical protein